MRAAGRLDEARAKNYIDVIYGALGELAHAALEALMATDFSTYRGAFAQKIYDEAHDKAFDEGLARGRDEGLARGRDEGTLDCAELELWTARAARATREEDLFAG